VIREFDFAPTMFQSDLEKAREIHRANGLDERCFPNLTIKNAQGEEVPNPLFVAKEIFEAEGKPVMMCFLKMTSELYLLIDHNVGTPEERWEWLQEFKEFMKRRAWQLGLEQMTAFVPTEIEESFSKRLLDLGFVKSPWQSYTLNVED
jgi:hypothetical protein